MPRIQNKKQKVRFAVVGSLNTFIDLGLYTLLNISGLNPVAANYVSTTAALVFSYFANGKFTFRDDDIFTFKKAIPFFGITLFGLWVIQPLIIIFTIPFVSSAAESDVAVSLIAKIVAAIITLSWNYFMYKKFVYRA